MTRSVETPNRPYRRYLAQLSPALALALMILLLPGLAACGETSDDIIVDEPMADESMADGSMSEPMTDGNAGMDGEQPGLDAWGRVLESFASDGGLNYAALKESTEDLDSYLVEVANTQPEGLGRDAQLAFWINAYNALTARSVLGRYPEIERVDEVDGFFGGTEHNVGKERLTLDAIEKKALALDDPRVHFVVVCASTGCPDLRAEPFRAQSLEQQLAEQTEKYLADEEKGLRYDAEAGVLYLSSIFDWYSGDFDGDPVAWILPRLPAELADSIRESDPEVKYLDYDWSLNDRS